MNWVAPSENDTAAATLEKRLRDAADQFRANSCLPLEATIAKNLAEILEA